MNIFYLKTISLLLVLSTPLLCACGSGRPKPYPVSGKVGFADGSPLAGGSIMFRSVGEGKDVFNARGLIKEDGTFTMTTFEPNDGAVAGEHQVMVRESGVNIEFQSAAAGAKLVDPRFMRYETSGLTVNVKEENNDLTIQIARPASRPK